MNTSWSLSFTETFAFVYSSSAILRFSVNETPPPLQTSTVTSLKSAGSSPPNPAAGSCAYRPESPETHPSMMTRPAFGAACDARYTVPAAPPIDSMPVPEL